MSLVVVVATEELLPQLYARPWPVTTPFGGCSNGVRALNDFSGGDFVGDVIGKNADAAHAEKV
jgi:hypothetical protein